MTCWSRRLQRVRATCAVTTAEKRAPLRGEVVFARLWTVRARDVRQSCADAAEPRCVQGCDKPSQPLLGAEHPATRRILAGPLTFPPAMGLHACAPKPTRSMSTRQSSSSTTSSVHGFVPAGLFAETGCCCIGKSASNSSSPLLDVRGEAADDAGAPPDGDQLVSVNRERRRKSSVAVSFESVPLESSERSSGPS